MDEPNFQEIALMLLGRAADMHQQGDIEDARLLVATAQVYATLAQIDACPLEHTKTKNLRRSK